jgi:23S rRNA (guanosine2251-2'-O)-methyltransferase
MMEEVIYGKNPVLEALRSGRELNKIWIAEGSKPQAVQAIYDEAKKRGIIVTHVPRAKLDQTAETKNHQGVLAFAAAYSYVEYEELLGTAGKEGRPPFLLLLDGIEDPHNLGSILRTADSSGVDGVIIPKRRAAGLTQVVAKASAGAIEYVPVCRVTNLAQTIEDLKERGYWVFGTDASAHTDYRQADFTSPVVLVIGSEGKGISRLIREKCDMLLRLPMLGRVTSLNASVAASILMYEVVRQRLPLK